MAYVSQELKAKLAPQLRAICKEYKVKASIAVRHHSTLVLNISQGEIDFIGNANKVSESKAHGRDWRAAKDSLDVNPYWFQEHFDGVALVFLRKIFAVMNDGNWDKSDVQTDYFNVGWYVDVNVGRWNKPYALVK